MLGLLDSFCFKMECNLLSLFPLTFSCVCSMKIDLTQFQQRFCAHRIETFVGGFGCGRWEGKEGREGKERKGKEEFRYRVEALNRISIRLNTLLFQPNSRQRESKDERPFRNALFG